MPKTGSDTVIGIGTATTWGSASTLGSGHRIEVESLTHSENPEELAATPIGSGEQMANDSQQGANAPTVNIDKIAHYNDGAVNAWATFFGTDTTTSLGSGGYIHSLIHNEVSDWRYTTLAFQGFSASTQGGFEFPTCVTTRLGFTAAEPPNYVKNQIDLLANNRLEGTSGAMQNSYGNLDVNVTMADTERVVLQQDDEFWINSQSGGALSSSDRLVIKSASWELTKERGFVKEIRGSGATGNSTPIFTGNPVFAGTLTVELRSMSDATYFDAAAAGTEYKARLTITGSLIGGSIYKKLDVYFPRLKIIEDPQYNLSDAGYNPLVITFKCLFAPTVPTGMADRYPYILLTNSKSTSYLA